MAKTAILLVASVLSACGGAAASGSATAAQRDPATAPAPAPPAATSAPVRHTRPARIDRMLAVARAVYANQVRGRHSLDVLHRVAHDPVLISDLQARNIAAARAYVAFKFQRTWYHWHVSRMRIERGGRRVTEVGVPFVLPPSSTEIRGAGGRPVGKLQVSMQDEIGFVRLMHRHHPVQVVLRGAAPSTLRTSLHAAALVKLPKSGTVRLGHTRYAVRSFQESSWEDGPVTIWILMK